MPIASTLAVIGPSWKAYRGPPAFFVRNTSKLRSRSQSASTPCSSSGRSTPDPTAANLVFSVTTIPPDNERPSRSWDGRSDRGTTQLRRPTGRHAALDPAGNGAAPSASSCPADGEAFLRRLGVDRPFAPVRPFYEERTARRHLPRLGPGGH